MEKDLGKLEPPSFGFRRKKRSRPTAAATEDPAPAEQEAAEPEPEPAPEPEPGPEDTQELPEPLEEPTEEIALSEQTVVMDDEEHEPAETVPADPGYQAPSDPLEADQPDDEETAERRDAESTDGAAVLTKPGKAARPRKTRKPRTKKPTKSATGSKPLLTGHPAAGATGLAVGLFLVLAVFAVERISQAVRGTSSLGGPGMLVLLGIFIVAVVGGAYVLQQFRIPSPGSISFLATGLVAVLAITFLTENMTTLWGGLVVLVLSVAAFVLSRWVTVNYIDQ